MEHYLSKPWYDSRPVPVFMTVFYCLIVLFQTGFWVFTEGYIQARLGDISIFSLLIYCVVSGLMGLGGLLLWSKKKSCSWCFVLALVTGLAIMFSHLRGESAAHLLSMPMFKEYALVFGIWVYSLQLRTTNYFSGSRAAD